MSAGREGRHAQRPATKEMFYDYSGADAGAQSGAFAGGRCSGGGDDVWTSCYLPHDFKRLVSIDIVLIEGVNLNNMQMTVATNWAEKGKYYTTNGEAGFRQWNAIANRLNELDISDMVDAGALYAGSYIGVRCTYLLNTNAIVLGVRIRYK